MGEPGFWDDPDAAGKVGAEHSRLGRRVETFEKLQADAGDLDGLVELGEEDEEIAAAGATAAVGSSATAVAAGAVGAGGGSVATKQRVANEFDKVGRNDPCPCGSGKKYKKCHGA